MDPTASRNQQIALVLLRTLIGWHFLYEGFTKVLTPAWSRAGVPIGRFTSAGYLRGSSGPFSDLFRGLADSSLLPWLDLLVAWGLVLIGVFVLIERRVAEPMLPLSIFRVPTMSASLLASLFQGLASFAVLFLLIMYLQGPRGLSPIHASLLLVPGYVLGSVAGPYAGRLADRRGPVLPATAGLAIQVVSLAIYAQLTVTTGLWVVVLASIINGIGASFFFPANSSAVMKAAPPEAFGIASGMLRTFANIGMVFSFAVAILIASRSISRGLAFAIFVGSTSLHGAVAVAFTSGLHAAFYASMGFMALAAALSALRVGSYPATRV
jgi:hypothetical protein